MKEHPYKQHKPVVIYPTRTKVLEYLSQHLPISSVVDGNVETSVCVKDGYGGADMYKVLWTDIG